jgi:hypothetical protein
MAPRKPTGQIGPFTATMHPSGPTGRWDRISFPTSKPEIERLIVDLFLREIRKTDAAIHEVKQNEEDDFDFALVLPGGNVWLDVTEIVYREIPSRPYDSRQIRIDSYPFAEQIRDAVMNKSAHYGKAGTQPIHLLAYITHWRFWPSEVVIRLAQHLLAFSRPIAENVFLSLPLDSTAAAIRVLYPSSDPLEGHDPDEFKDHWSLTLDPANWQLQTDQTKT